MIFIEELRRNKEISEQIRQEKVSETKEEREKKEKVRLEAQYYLAEGFYLSSAFPKLIEALVEHDGWVKSELYRSNLYSDGRVTIGLEKKISRDIDFRDQLHYHREIETRQIHIIVDRYGNVEVNGDEYRGSTSLCLAYCTTEKQGEALRKAWIYPRKMVFGDSSASTDDNRTSTGSYPSQPY